MTRLEAKYFLPCLIELPCGTVIDAKMARDGLSYKLPATATVTNTLTVCYPTKDGFGWFFNATRDRYIAEIIGNEISVNPQFITKFCEVAV